MPIVKNLKKKGVSMLASSKNRNKNRNGGSDKATAKNQRFLAKKRSKSGVDAWDMGASERIEHEKAVKSGESKRIKFEPAPAKLILPSKDDDLRRRMGEFAGPLLGALWEDKAPVSGVSFEPVKSAPPASKRDANKFAALASDSEEDETFKAKENKLLFKAPVLDISRQPMNLFAKQQPVSKSSGLMFKPSVLDASQLLNKPQTSPSTTVVFREASFQAHAASANASSAAFQEPRFAAPQSIPASSSSVMFRESNFQAPQLPGRPQNEPSDWDDL
jgi:hypothetical protein